MSLLSLLRHGGHLGLFLHDGLLVLLLHLLLKLRRHLGHRGWVAPMSRLDVGPLSMARCGMVLGPCRTCRQQGDEHHQGALREVRHPHWCRSLFRTCRQFGHRSIAEPTLVPDGGHPSRTRVPYSAHMLLRRYNYLRRSVTQESSTRQETRHSTIEPPTNRSAKSAWHWRPRLMQSRPLQGRSR